jgi:hypothetical protein
MLAALTLSMAGLVSIIITLLIFGCIVGLLFYLIHIVPIPAPYKGWILIVLQVLVVLVLIGMLLGFAGYPIVTLR